MTDECATLECGHIFHANCAVKWFRGGNKTCPLCRREPDITMRPPDVLERARMVLASGAHTTDPALAEHVAALERDDDALDAAQAKLREYKVSYTAGPAARKTQILREYRCARASFRAVTTPMLKELGKIDAADVRARNDLESAIGVAKKRRRARMRAIGLWTSIGRAATGGAPS